MPYFDARVYGGQQFKVISLFCFSRSLVSVSILRVYQRHTLFCFSRSLVSVSILRVYQRHTLFCFSRSGFGVHFCVYNSALQRLLSAFGEVAQTTNIGPVSVDVIARYVLHIVAGCTVYCCVLCAV